MERTPEDFLISLLREQYAPDVVEKIINGFRAERFSSFRINRLKSTVGEVEEILRREDIAFSHADWFSDAFIIKRADEWRVCALPIYEEGGIYMQSLSSMLPPLILGASEGDRVLDMAAAPGGKTTEISSLTGNKALVTACEKNKIRAERLAFNLKKQGATRTSVLAEDALKLSPYMSFDKILLDAPCSGSGTVAMREGKTEHMFSEKLLYNCIKTQYLLLKKAVELVKVGGIIVYSTCSVLEKENEGIIKKILSEGRVRLESIGGAFASLPLLPSATDGVICVCPDEKYEGFFLSRLIKIK